MNFKVLNFNNKYSLVCRQEFSLYGNCVLALGSFDGVHIAHTELCHKCIQLKDHIGAQLSGAFCFSENPLQYLTNEVPAYLTTWQQKSELLLKTGLDFVIVASFPSFKDMEADEYINFLKDTFGCIGVCCGYNFRFGKGGKGDYESLVCAFGKEHSFVLCKMTLGQTQISSTQIRQYISQGKMDDVCSMLGYNYSITSPVVEGKKLGRTIGFPTINQVFDSGMAIPLFGIYAVLCTLDDGSIYTGVANVGIRPTVSNAIDSHEVNCETYIHNFNMNLYGQTVKTEFCHFLRPERKFNSIEELTKQIQSDSEHAIEYFTQVGFPQKDVQ